MNLQQKIALWIGGTVTALSFSFGIYQAFIREAYYPDDLKEIACRFESNPLSRITNDPKEFIELFLKEKEEFDLAQGWTKYHCIKNVEKNLLYSSMPPAQTDCFGSYTGNDLGKEIEEIFKRVESEREKYWFVRD